ncbi:MAG: hypothetical protein M0D54_05545 [Hyphomonadaceae bacterium JAD_PAG50586_4]|nr:MAG: hypothetical protein M0D54_05545 [Hyphomonadaceae bacterium JAD_PAG50586_4]
MGVRERTIGAHPIFTTLAYAVVFASGALPRLIPGFSVSSFAVTTALLIFVLWWNWSLYSLAREATPQFSTPLGNLFGRAVFVLALGGWFALLILANNAFMFLAGIGHLVSVWIAASALVKSELKQDWFPWWSVFGTFLLVFYLPIGVWFLHSRLQRLLNRQPHSGAN